MNKPFNSMATLIVELEDSVALRDSSKVDKREERERKRVKKRRREKKRKGKRKGEGRQNRGKLTQGGDHIFCFPARFARLFTSAGCTCITI